MRIACSVGSLNNLSPQKISSLSPFYLRESFVGGGLQRDDESVCVCVLVYTHLRSGFLLFFFTYRLSFFLAFVGSFRAPFFVAGRPEPICFVHGLKEKEKKKRRRCREFVYLFYI